MGIVTGSDGRPIYGSDGLPIYTPGTLPAYRSYGAMQARIADEMIDGAVTTAHIQNAITDAIRDYEQTDFYFNKMRQDQNFSLTAGKEFYSPDDFSFLGTSPNIDQISVFAFGNRWQLECRTEQWIEEMSIQPSWQALPTDWCFTGGVLRVYPIPDNAYPLIFTGTMRWQMVAADQDANPWTDDAERLIRSRAKAILYRDILRDEPSAQINDQQEARQLSQLKRETTKRLGGPGRVRVGMYF